MTGKPGRPRTITVDQIVQATLADGLTTFSMPSVARRVGVAHSALYRYVENREGLLIAAIDHALDSAEWPVVDQPWQDLMRRVADVVWSTCEKFVGLDRATIDSSRATATWTRHLETYVAELVRQGFSPDDAATVVGLVVRVALISSHERADEPGQRAHEARLDIVLAGADTLRVS